jgi:DNA modification methylase
VQQLTTRKSVDGYMGITDFRGQVIQAFLDGGWHFYGEVTIWKNPQAQAIRTKAHPLMFVTKNRDSAQSRPALGDYLLLFRKPGENAVPINNDVSNEEWIDWAAPIWEDKHDGGWLTKDGQLCPVWYGIKETDTLNVRVARANADERHICPLQLPFIERCVRLWSNPRELVLTPFAGIGSEVYVAVKLGRKAVGIELKPKYYTTAVNNMRELEQSERLMRQAKTQTKRALMDKRRNQSMQKTSTKR